MPRSRKTRQAQAAASTTREARWQSPPAIANNSGLSYGGGIDDNTGPLKVTNSTIANNSAPSGGGIYCATASSTLTTVNTTMVYNTRRAGGGGGLDVAAGTSTLYNTIVALNTDGSGAAAR